MDHEPVSATEIFKALGDPIRWSIVQQVAATDELPCGLLEDTLPVSKPTISYHTRILTQAGLIEAHKHGRTYSYSLRRDVLRGVLDSLGTLDPALRPASGTPVPEPARPALKAAGDEVGQQARLITW